VLISIEFLYYIKSLSYGYFICSSLVSLHSDSKTRRSEQFSNVMKKILRACFLLFFLWDLHLPLLFLNEDLLNVQRNIPRWTGWSGHMKLPSWAIFTVIGSNFESDGSFILACFCSFVWSARVSWIWSYFETKWFVILHFSDDLEGRNLNKIKTSQETSSQDLFSLWF